MRRTFAAIAKASSQYAQPLKAENQKLTSSVLPSGVKVITVEDSQSPISTVGVLISAGPALQQGSGQVGYAQFLRQSAFKSTNERSRIRITKEADMLGSHLSAHLLDDRKTLLIQAQVQRDDVQDSVKLLTEIVDGFVTRDEEADGIYSREHVRKQLEWMETNDQLHAWSDHVWNDKNAFKGVVMDEVYRIAYGGKGLGMPMYPQMKEINPWVVLNEFATKTFVAEGMTFVGLGVSQEDMVDALVSSKLSIGTGKNEVKSQYLGGESYPAISTPEDQAYYVVAYPAGNVLAAKVLKNLVGSNETSCIKYASGMSLLGQKNLTGLEVEAFADGALFGVCAQGSDPKAVSSAVKEAVASLKIIGDADVKRAVAITKTELVTRFESSVAADRLQSLNDQVQIFGNTVSAQKLVQEIGKVSTEDIKKLVASFKKATVVGFGDAYSGFSEK